MEKIKNWFLTRAVPWLSQPPSLRDSLILSTFVVLITFHPYYNQGKINLFEVGLYLPGIQAILNGQIPYRDFFHLRGPFELYLPAFFMKIFGVHLDVLYFYFFAGNVVFLYWHVGGIAATRLSSIAKLSIALICLFCWVFLLSSAAEKRAAVIPLGRNALEEKRLLDYLESLNATLLRTAGK